MDPNELQAEMQKLARQGKRKEIQELSERMTQQSQWALSIRNTPAVVEEWVKALEELAVSKNAYPISIRFQGF